MRTIYAGGMTLIYAKTSDKSGGANSLLKPKTDRLGEMTTRKKEKV